MNDLGQVIDSVQNDKTAGWLNFTRAIVLGIQRQPGTNTVEVVDAIKRLMLFRMELNLYTFVGVIMLVGIVKKNAIMMIDFALEAQRNEGKSPADAIYEGCMVRFRPIMMTTMAALFGTLLIAIGFGAGAAARRPLGIAVVGGLLFSQLITLYITPVYYTYPDSFERWLGRRLRRRDAADDYISETGSGG